MKTISIHLVIVALTIASVFLWHTNKAKDSMIRELSRPLTADIIANENNIPDCFYSEVPDSEALYTMLVYFNVPCPAVVLAQAQLETGHFKYIPSRNLFGLYSGNNLMRFDHWTESVVAYKRYISERYTGDPNNVEQYLAFLEVLGYADAEDYNKLLRQLIKSNNKPLKNK